MTPKARCVASALVVDLQTKQRSVLPDAVDGMVGSKEQPLQIAFVDPTLL